MDVETFKRVLSTFTDDADSFQVSKGVVVAQLRDTLIEATLVTKDYQLYINEEGILMPAEKWIVSRVARLDLLADRLIALLDRSDDFVTPSGKYLHGEGADEDTQIDNAVGHLTTAINQKPTGSASVLYLTSDAGEGKTTLINHLARQQAVQFKEGKASWLLVPISLGGRPFLRFDEVIAGALMNRFRFPMLYFESFMEMVRIGSLVPALDGFEEMFVENAEGDALSALGSLLSSMKSSGAVVIAARKAYFEFTNLHSQARLFDSLGSDDISFSRLCLDRWSQKHFVEYASKRGVKNGIVIYDDIAQKLGADHSILTRPVLVSRLLQIALEQGDREKLIARLGESPHDYFYEFVDTIIDREALRKWIDKDGETAKPLLTVDEHHSLLGSIALEMWTQSVDSLKAEIFELLAEVFCDHTKKGVRVSRQVRQRICQHALIVSDDSRLKTYRFDHEEFRNFFLGEGIAQYIADENAAELLRIIRKAQLPTNAVDATICCLRKRCSKLNGTIAYLMGLVKNESLSYYSRENAGNLIIRILAFTSVDSIIIDTMSFGSNALAGRIVNDVVFKECTFSATSFEGSFLKNCIFEQCTFEHLYLPRHSKLENVSLHEPDVHGLTLLYNGINVFDPHQIISVLGKHGFKLTESEEENSQSNEFEPDEHFIATEKALRTFQRRTIVGEGLFLLRLGPRASLFISSLLPTLVKSKVIVDATGTVGGAGRKYRLGIPMLEVVNALDKAQGNFNHFISLVGSN